VPEGDAGFTFWLVVLDGRWVPPAGLETSLKSSWCAGPGELPGGAPPCAHRPVSL